MIGLFLNNGNFFLDNIRNQKKKKKTWGSPDTLAVIYNLKCIYTYKGVKRFTFDENIYIYQNFLHVLNTGFFFMVFDFH